MIKFILFTVWWFHNKKKLPIKISRTHFYLEVIHLHSMSTKVLFSVEFHQLINYKKIAINCQEETAEARKEIFGWITCQD